MGARRTVILMAAIVIAGLAAVATYSYLNGVQDRAYHNATLVKVFRVKQDIPKGMPGENAIDKGFIETADTPTKFRPATALTNLSLIRGKVAPANIPAGVTLVDGQFVDPRVATVSSAQRIPAGQVAITVSLDDVHAVGGLLQPGDKVNMLVQAGDTERFLYQNVDILFIGSNAAPQAGDTQTSASSTATKTAGSGLITFSVPPVAAEKIAMFGAQLYLTLVPPDYQPQAVPPVNGANLFTGGLTPYGA